MTIDEILKRGAEMGFDVGGLQILVSPHSPGEEQLCFFVEAIRPYTVTLADGKRTLLVLSPVIKNDEPIMLPPLPDDVVRAAFEKETSQ